MTMRQVRVSVPGSTSNLGPAFDCLGLALSLRNELTLELHEGSGEALVEIEGEAVSAWTQVVYRVLVSANDTLEFVVVQIVVLELLVFLELVQTFELVLFVGRGVLVVSGVLFVGLLVEFVVEFVVLGAGVVGTAAAWYLRAQRFRRWFAERMAEVFANVDVLLAPATPVCARTSSA